MLLFRRPLALLCLALGAALGAALAAERGHGQYTTIYNIPPDTVVVNLNPGTQVNVFDGGYLTGLSAYSGTQINVFGGTTGRLSVDSSLNVSGGVVAEISANSYSSVQISGGEVPKLTGWANSSVIASGGAIGDGFKTHQSRIVLSGARVGSFFGAGTGTLLDLSGGTVGDHFEVLSGATFKIFGNEFFLDGAPVAGLGTVGATTSVTPVVASTLTGTLADGTPFAFVVGPLDGDQLLYPITLVAAALPATGPAAVTIAGPSTQVGVRSGQTLTVASGGILPSNFNAGRGSRVVIAGGTVGKNFEAVGATVDISGGTVGDGFDAMLGSHVTLSGGTMGYNAQAFRSSTLHVAGGAVGDALWIDAGSKLLVSGGSVGDNLILYPGSQAEISGGHVGGHATVYTGSALRLTGGSIGDYLTIQTGVTLNVDGGAVGDILQMAPYSAVNLRGGSIGDRMNLESTARMDVYGTSFLIDGVDITSTLTPYAPKLITQRYVTLSGVLADGSPLNMKMVPSFTAVAGESHIDSSAVFRVVLVGPGDFDADGDVDGADFLRWQQGKSPQPMSMSDLAAWRTHFGTIWSQGTSLAVPEPGSFWMALGAAAVCCSRGRVGRRGRRQ